MKKIGFLLIAVLMVVCFFCVATSATAGTYNVTVTWEMEYQATDLVGYEIGINEDVPIDVLGSDVRSWSGDVELSDGDNAITVRAYDEAGQRSAWSDAAGYDPAPGVPSITVVIVR